MPVYTARIDLTGSPEDANASLNAVADSADSAADQIEERLGAASDKASESISSIPESAEKAADGISTAFDGAVADTAKSAATIEGSIGDAYEGATAKASESLETLVDRTEASAATAGEALDTLAVPREAVLAVDTADLDAAVATATAGVDELARPRTVLVGADVDPLLASVSTADAAIQGISAAPLPVSADTSGLEAQLAAASATEEGIGIPAALDTSELGTGITAASAQLDSLVVPRTVKVAIDNPALDAGVTTAEASLAPLSDPRTVSVLIDSAAVDTQVTAVETTLDGLSKPRSVPLAADTAGLEGEVAQASTSIDTLVSHGAAKAETLGTDLAAPFGDAVTASKAMVGGVATNVDAMEAATEEKLNLLDKRIDATLARAKLATSALTAPKPTTPTRTVATSAENDLPVPVKTPAKTTAAETTGESEGGVLSSAGEKVTLGVAGIALESTHLADQHEIAQAQLRTAIDATGQHFSAWEAKVKAADAAGSHLGFTSNEVESAFASLTTSTNNPTKALQELTLAEEIATGKNIDLADSTSLLVKTNAGSTRGLTALGINLDIGSGKYHSIQSQTEAVTKAQIALKTAQASAAQTGVTGSFAYSNALLSEKEAANSLAESHASGSASVASALEKQKVAQAEVASGQIKGAAAVGALQEAQLGLTDSVQSGSFKGTAAYLAYEKAQAVVSQTTEKGSYAQVAALQRVADAQLTLKNAQLNLQESKTAIPKIFDTLEQRYKGAGANYAQTVAGQVKIAEAEVQNLGISFGEDLAPKEAKALESIEGFFTYLGAHKRIASDAEHAIEGIGAALVAAFAEKKIAGGVKLLGGAVKDIKTLVGLPSKAITGIEKLLGGGAKPVPTVEGGTGSTPTTGVVGSLDGLAGAADKAAAALERINPLGAGGAAGTIERDASVEETAALAASAEVKAGGASLMTGAGKLLASATVVGLAAGVIYEERGNLKKFGEYLDKLPVIGQSASAHAGLETLPTLIKEIAALKSQPQTASTSAQLLKLDEQEVVTAVKAGASGTLGPDSPILKALGISQSVAINKYSVGEKGDASTVYAAVVKSLADNAPLGKVSTASDKLTTHLDNHGQKVVDNTTKVAASARSTDANTSTVSDSKGHLDRNSSALASLTSALRTETAEVTSLAQSVAQLVGKSHPNIFGDLGTGGAAPFGPVIRGANGQGVPSSLTNHYELSGPVTIQSNDPGDMGRQLQIKARRSNLVRT